MTKRFTGWHMTAIMLAFFGVVIAVNITMATFATRTFGGTVVDNSYVASQKFNAWLEAAREQEKLGWTSHVALDERRHVMVVLSIGTNVLGGVHLTGRARHPLGREADIPLRFAEGPEGSFRSSAALPPGRWLIHLKAARGSDEARLVDSLS